LLFTPSAKRLQGARSAIALQVNALQLICSAFDISFDLKPTEEQLKSEVPTTLLSSSNSASH
jgi:hypothetical protein